MTIRIGLTVALKENRSAQMTCPPLGLAFLSSYIKKNLEDCEVVYKLDLNQLLDFHPDIIGISAVSQNYPVACQIASKIKKLSNIPIIIGGTHITALPSSLSRALDIGVIGEGEHTFFSLVLLFSRFHKFPDNELAKIPGIVYHSQEGQLISTPIAKKLDLREIPLPDVHMFSGDFFPEDVYMVISRGCPYQCAFCSTSHTMGKYRYFSPDYIVRWIESLPALPRHIVFQDSFFCTNLQFLKRLIMELKEHGILGKVTFHLSTRAELMTEQIADLLCTMGVRSMSFGAESGSDRVLKYLKGKTSSVQSNQNCIDISRSRSISVIPSFLIGSPGETVDDLWMTVDFVDRNMDKLAYFDFYPAIPYPGTPFWDYAIQKQMIREDFDMGSFDIDFLNINTNKYLYMNKEAMSEADFWRGYVEMLTRYTRIQERNWFFGKCE